MPRSRRRPAAARKIAASRRYRQETAGWPGPADGDPGLPVVLLEEPGGKRYTASLRLADNGWLSEDLAYDPGGPEGWPFIAPPEDFAEAPWDAWLRTAERFRKRGRAAADAMLAVESAPFRLARPGRDTITTCLAQVFSVVSDSVGSAQMAEWISGQPQVARCGLIRWDQGTGTVVVTVPADEG